MEKFEIMNILNAWCSENIGSFEPWNDNRCVRSAIMVSVEELTVHLENNGIEVAAAEDAVKHLGGIEGFIKRRYEDEHLRDIKTT